MPTEERPPSTTPLSDDATQIIPRQWGEPPPKHVEGPIMHDLVAQDLQSRSNFGLNKYGTNLRAFNGRDPLKDAYEEVLDLAVYLRQVMYERDMRESWMKEGEKTLPPVVRGEKVNPFKTTQMSLFDDPDKTLKMDLRAATEWK